MATEAEVEIVLRMLVDAYPEWAREQGPEQLMRTFAMYTMLLVDMPNDVLRAAAVKHAACSKWFPKASELREACAAVGAPERTSALEAWGEVCLARLRWDRYACGGNAPYPEFSNPIILRIVRSMGGLSKLQESDMDIEVADRARFLQEYNVLVEREAERRLELPQVREVRERLQSGNGRLAGLLGDMAGKMRHD